MSYTSTERRILVAAAGAPLRWRDGRGGTWLRTDLPPPLRAAALSLSETRVTAAGTLLRQAGLLEAATTPEGPGLRITRAGLLAAGDVAEGFGDEQRRALRQLYRAGEAVRRGRPGVPDLHPGELRGLPGGIVIEWVAPVRSDGAECPDHICYGNSMGRLEHKGLAVVIGSRALLTGGGEWAAELLWPDLAAKAPSSHAKASDGRGAPGLGADPETARETPQRPSNGAPS